MVMRALRARITIVELTPSLQGRGQGVGWYNS